METQGLLGEKYGNIRIPGEVEAAEFEMILDAAAEAKLETRLLEEWFCRDENSVPAAYYLRPRSEMLRSHGTTVSRPPLQRAHLSVTSRCRCHLRAVFSTEKAEWTESYSAPGPKFLLTAKSTLGVREMPIKTTVRHHLTPVRTAIIKSKDCKCWWGRAGKGTLVQGCWDCRLV